MAESEPKLAPPGAGIPWIARVALKLYVNPFFAGKEPLEVMRARFESKHRKIVEEYRSIPESLREKKVLVPSQRGLEDSSRFWSAAMVLEHLEIVGTAVIGAIVKLANDEEPGMKADTATVKPRGAISAGEIFASFDRWWTGAMAHLDTKVPNFDSKRTMPHPWFGEFTARKWLWLLGVHADIHLVQIRAIRRGLGLPSEIA